MILGHDRQKEYFNNLFKKNKLAHAYLFYGPERVGKFSFARSIIEKLNCPYPIILDTEHTLVSEKENRKEIPIKDIQALKRQFSLAVPEGQWQVAVINEAEKLNEESADAFLKLLEEPGERTLFFLITASKDLLPATIVSRAQPVRFSLVSQNVLAEYLQTRTEAKETHEEILSLSFGRPGIMLRLLEDKDYLLAERKFFNSLRTIRTAPEIFRFSAKAAGDEESRKKTADFILQNLREKMLASPHPALAQKIKRACEIISAAETTNVNPRLALDALLLEAIT